MGARTGPYCCGKGKYIGKTIIRQVPSRAKLYRKSLNFRYVPEPRIKWVLKNPRHAITTKQVLRRPHWQRFVGKSTKCVVVEVKSLLRHIFQERRPVEFWCEQGALSRHTWVQTSCPCRTHSHASPNDLTLSPRSQVHRTRRAQTFHSSACELMVSINIP